MATITLPGFTFGCTMGMGAFEGIGTAFTGAKQSARGLSEVLGTLKSKIDIAAVAARIEASREQAKKAEERENIKKSSLSLAYEKLNILISDTGSVDLKASSKIRERKDAFYERYNYLKPECEKTKKEIRAEKWEKIKSDVAEWCKEHWKAIATVIIVVVAVVLICTGVGGPLGAAAIGALIGAGTGGLLGGIMSLATGGSFWEGFESGAFSGAIAGIITGVIGFGFVGGTGVPLTLGQTVLTGTLSSGGASLLTDLGDKFIRGDNLSFCDILVNTFIAAGTGALLSAAGYGIGKIASSIKQRVFPSKNIQNAPYIKDGKPNGRPSPTGKAKDNFINELFKKQVDIDGVLRDPNTGQVIPWKPGDPMKGIVDVGHKSGKEYAKVFAKYQQGKWSLDKLKAFQSNPKNFYLESASSNRSHAFEGSLLDMIIGKNFPWLSGSVC